MRRLCSAFVVLALAVAAIAQTAAQGTDVPRVVLISIDGLMPSSYTDPALAQYTPTSAALRLTGCGQTASSACSRP